MNSSTFDIVIAGSGFAGSIAAMALTRSGFNVCLLESGRHPRFAIGESSTPVADMILRSLADRYDLPMLYELSRFGSWKAAHPELLCGIKRGFAYYSHIGNASIDKSENRQPEQMLVAASSSDADSDTHWYRSDLDAFLVKSAIDIGVTYHDRTTIVTSEPAEEERSILYAEREGESHRLNCRWLIDATGSPTLLSRLYAIPSSASGFMTNSRALYSHWEGAGRWETELIKRNVDTAGYPFSPDDSALHHLVDAGWIWSLRFRNGLLSSGLVIDHTDAHAEYTGRDPERIWKEVLTTCPSIGSCFEHARISDPPGRMISTGRLQRRLQRIYGNNWIALNHTAGFVDPLHSTGIAHSLTGLERILKMFLQTKGRSPAMQKELEKHQGIYFRELELIDRLVAGCYATRKHFELFHAFTMLYFAATVNYESERLAGKNPDHYLSADNPLIFETVERTRLEVDSLLEKPFDKTALQRVVARVRKRIAPYNNAGLLDPAQKMLYHHTAVELK